MSKCAARSGQPEANHRRVPLDPYGPETPLPTAVGKKGCRKRHTSNHAWNCHGDISRISSKYRSDSIREVHQPFVQVPRDAGDKLTTGDTVILRVRHTCLNTHTQTRSSSAAPDTPQPTLVPRRRRPRVCGRGRSLCVVRALRCTRRLRPSFLRRRCG